MLTVLKLHSCEGITSASMAAISHSYMLEVWIHLLQILALPECLCCLNKWYFQHVKNDFIILLQVLELDNCSLLTSVSLDLPRLQNIRLVHCRKYALLLYLIFSLPPIFPKKSILSLFLFLVEIFLFHIFFLVLIMFLLQVCRFEFTEYHAIIYNGI